MAILRPDIYQHNNPVRAIADSDFVKGGIRGSVETLAGIYALSGNTGTPTSAGQVKERSTLVFVESEGKYYELIDIDNIDNASGWQPFLSDINDITNVAITGATNGLTKEGNHVVELGGALTKSTTIEISNGTSLFIDDSRGDTRGIKYNADYSTYFTDRSLVDKGYVDAIASGLIPISSVDVATTENITLSGLQEVDGVTLTGGQRVLVKNQTNAAENGIYIATGDTWQRAEDYDGDPESEVRQGQIIPVLDGDTHANQLWVLITPDPIDVGTTNLTFVRFSKPLDVLDGNGIEITESGTQKTISVDLVNNGGLDFENTQLTINQTIAGDGLNWNAGVLSIESSSIGLTGATNGLSVVGQDVVLGGTLTGNTEINGNNYDHGFGLYDVGYFDVYSNGVQLSSYDGGGVFIQDQTGGGGVFIESNDGGGVFLESKDDGGIRIRNTGTNLGGTDVILEAFVDIHTRNSINVGINGTTYVDSTNNGGIKYNDDYANDFTLRSLPDVAYVTGLTDSLQTEINNIDVGLTGATNGLSVVGQDVVLGGTLTGNTTISGATGTAFTLTTSSISLAGDITITNTPAEIDEEAFSVLVRDDSSGELKTVEGGELGEDNNNYFITTASTSITTTTDMYVILVDSSATAVTITLPVTPVDGQVYKIKDATCDAITNIITIDGAGKDIDNGSTAVINTDYGAIEIAYDEDFDKWFVLSFVN